MHYRNATHSDLYEMMDDLHNDPNIQETMAQFLGLKWRFGNTMDRRWLREYINFARENAHILPIYEVRFNGAWWSCPVMIMSMFSRDLIRLGILPRRPRRKN